MRLGAVIHGLGLVTLEQGIHLVAVDLHTFGIVFAQIGACKKIKRLCEICADRAVQSCIINGIVYHIYTLLPRLL